MADFGLLFLFLVLALLLIVIAPLAFLILTIVDFRRFGGRLQFSILELLAVPLSMGYFTLVLSLLEKLMPSRSEAETYFRVIMLASHFTIGGACGWLRSGLRRESATGSIYRRIAAAFIGAHFVPIASVGTFFAIWILIVKIAGLR